MRPGSGTRFAAVLALALWSCTEIPAAPDPQLATGAPPSAPAVADRNLFVYALDGRGGLTPLAGSPFPSGGRIDDVESLSARDPHRLLFVASDASNSFSVLRFDHGSGALRPVAGSPFQAEGLQPSATETDGRFLFVGHAGSNTISTFRLGPQGIPNSVPDSPAPTGGQLLEGMTLDPRGRFLLTTNATSNNVSVLRIATDGSLAAVPGSPFPGVFSPDEPIVHPNGRFVFVTNRSQPSLSVFALGVDGSLAPVPGSPFPAPAGFTTYEHCVLNSRGTLLFATFESPPAILAYRVGEDGSLTLVPGTPVLLGTPGPGGPEGMALDPADRFIYVADHIANRLHVLRIKRDGGLVPVVPGGVPIAAEPLDVIIPGWRVRGRLVMVVSAVLH